MLQQYCISLFVTELYRRHVSKLVALDRLMTNEKPSKEILSLEISVLNPIN